MEKKTFAFKLADRNAKAASKWTARDGVSLAGCSNVGDYQYRLSDSGYYC
jgi:hypothetical protein